MSILNNIFPNYNKPGQELIKMIPDQELRYSLEFIQENLQNWLH